MIKLDKLAIITPSRLGDTIFITPLIRFARHCYPYANIDVFTMGELSASALKGSPYIDQLYVLSTETPLKDINNFNNQYDVAFSAFEIKRTQAIASSLAETAIISPPMPEIDHRTVEILQFFCKAMEISETDLNYKYELFPNNNDRKTAERLLNSRQPQSATLVGLHIGCHQFAKNRSKLRHWWRNQQLHHKASIKTWPIDSYAKLIDLSYQQYGTRVQFILTGTEHENFLAQPLTQKNNVINLIGKTSVLELAALMDKLSIYITGDTGSLHVACATDVHVIGLFGPTEETITGPYPKHHSHTILKRTQCVSSISPMDVMQAIQAKIDPIPSQAINS